MECNNFNFNISNEVRLFTKELVEEIKQRPKKENKLRYGNRGSK